MSRSCRPVRVVSFALVALVLAMLGIAAPAAVATDGPALDPPAVEPPPPPPPPPSDGSSPPGDTTPTPPTDPTPPPESAPSDGPQNSGGAPEEPAPSQDPASAGSDRSSDSFVQGNGSSTGAGADSSHAASPGATAGTQDRSNTKTDSLIAIPPGVDNFDSFSGTSSGGSTLLLDSSPTCGGVSCGSGAGGLAAGVAVSAKQLQQDAARERDASRVDGLAKAMPPSPPGGIPGRAFSMPGSAGGGGAAFVLLGMVAILGTALAMGNWTTSFRLPTATWRLSAYVPPIEHPG